MDEITRRSTDQKANETTYLLNENVQRTNTFKNLTERIHACHLCPRMEGRTRVFGPANGSIETKILFIAEAPGRLGADRSGIPLTGDQTGRNFDMLLQAAQIKRSEIFITNAVLCNPRDTQGYNAPPIPQEIENCSRYLRETLTLIQPHYIIALGNTALRALSYITSHELTLSRHVGSPQQWDGRWLIAFYHPSPRAQTYRSREKQIEDFKNLGVFIHSQ